MQQIGQIFSSKDHLIQIIIYKSNYTRSNSKEWECKLFNTFGHLCTFNKRKTKPTKLVHQLWKLLQIWCFTNSGTTCTNQVVQRCKWTLSVIAFKPPRSMKNHISYFFCFLDPHVQLTWVANLVVFAENTCSFMGTFLCFCFLGESDLQFCPANF